MPTNAGPNTYGEDSLVFGYDLADTGNSYKGKPAYNLTYDTDSNLFWRNGWNNSGTSTYKYDTSDIQYLKDALPAELKRRFTDSEVKINANLKTSNDGISSWNVNSYGNTSGFIVGDLLWVTGDTSNSTTSYLRVNGVDGNGAITSLQMWYQGYGYVAESATLSIRTSSAGVINTAPTININSALSGSTQLGVGYATIQEGKTYTLSTYFYRNNTTFDSSAPYIRSNNAYQAALSYRGSTNWQEWPANKWIRISATYTAPAGHTNVYISSYTSYKGNFIAYCLPQVEEVTNSNQKPSPVVFGSRSATQGLIDLTGNSTIDLTNVSFDSNAQMTFDGTDDSLPLGTSSTFQFPHNLPWTIEFVAKANSFVNQYPGFLVRGAASGDGVLVFYSAGGQTHWKHNNSQTQFHTQTIGQYNHYVITHNGSGTVTAYVDGINKGTVGNMSATNTNASLLIGRGDNYGDNTIPVFKKYNRVLTASEVASNYKAIKGRFNI